jgi:hypothetical protein
MTTQKTRITQRDQAATQPTCGAGTLASDVAQAKATLREVRSRTRPGQESLRELIDDGRQVSLNLARPAQLEETSEDSS